MKQTLGFLATSIEDSTKSKFIIDIINKFSGFAPYLDHILFNSYYNILNRDINKFATLHLNEAKYFTGPIITFNLSDALFLKQCISKQKILFITEPEWVDSINLANDGNSYEKTQLMQYRSLRDIYINSMDLLITNTQELKQLIDICWKPSVLITENEYEKIYENIQL